tara:strand:- start:3474 stop:5999 length:2526 start_codon:yes stop_codon:yes gene_type:complete
MAFRGLNVSLALNDIDNKAESLRNLGLDQRDVALITGLTSSTGNISVEEFHTVSGLVDDQKKVLYALTRASEVLSSQLTSLRDVKQPFLFNYRVNDRVMAGAIKYKYYDFASNISKNADISTSRVSSWSTIGTGADAFISYGGEIKVVGPQLTLSSLKTTVAPIGKTFRSEVPTHIVKLDINGVSKSFLAMKGIPLEWTGFFRNAYLQAAVTPVSDSAGQVPITWRVTNEDNGQSYNSGDGSSSFPQNIGVGSFGSPTVYDFRDSRSRPRKLEFFYDPSKVLELRMPNINLSDWTTVSLPALRRLVINSNDFYQLPSFRDGTSSKTSLSLDGLAPALTHVDISSNNLSRARDSSNVQITANEQLNTLPTSLISLTMNGSFNDGTIIDLLDHTNLTTLNFSSYYARRASRRQSGTISPKVATSIQRYSLSHQSFQQMCHGVTSSTNLAYLAFPHCGINSADNGSGTRVELTIASTSLAEFHSYSNHHQVVDMNGNTNLKIYIQQRSNANGIGGTSAQKGVSGKFTGCTALNRLDLYNSGIVADIGTVYQNLPALNYIEARYSGISGEFRDNSFTGSPSMQTILLAGSNLGLLSNNLYGTDFFGTAASSTNGTVFHNTPDIRNVYAYSNKNIRGTLPDFSLSEQLRVVYLHNTGLSGNLTSFGNNDLLRYIRIDYTKNGADGGISGSVPAFSTPALNYLFLTYNNLSGQVPDLTCPYLYYLYLGQNALTGTIPDLRGCVRLYYIQLNNNLMTSYNAGNLQYNIYARTIDLSNNRLVQNTGPTIIDDLLKNWTANPRSGVSVNMLGNNGLTEATTRADGSGDGENSTSVKLDTLRQKGWSILMD